ncbi:hypothetical protein I3842_12G005700 [Carya illinoinensis]|uniref:Uncharacterized protein n=1 Tax=Carya illinoinensis TaxID=32201 RepID=A0A922DF87_CARIL|nr:hypothetical protein I3842_12G005700 [Carya illinoinensis]
MRNGGKARFSDFGACCRIHRRERNQRGRKKPEREISSGFAFGRRRACLGSPSNGRHPCFRIDLSHSVVGERVSD